MEKLAAVIGILSTSLARNYILYTHIKMKIWSHEPLLHESFQESGEDNRKMDSEQAESVGEKRVAAIRLLFNLSADDNNLTHLIMIIHASKVFPT